MSLSNVIDRGRTLVSNNSATILTTVGVAGTITTAYLTGQASFKAAEIIRRRELALRHESDGHGDLNLRDKAELVWTEYIPAAGVGVTTVAAIILANRLSSREAAALAAAYGISEQALSQYKAKVVDKFGDNKARAIRDEIAQDHLNAHPVVAKEVIITGNGDVLCKDALSGRFFMSSHESVQKAANAVNFTLIHHMHASLSAFYSELGLDPTGMSDDLGWNSDHPVELSLSTGLSSDNRPCLVIDFATLPFPNYTRLY